MDGEARGCQGRWELPVTISLNIQGRRSFVSWIALSWDGERDSRGGFDRIGAEGSFVGSAWALSIPCVFWVHTGIWPEGTPLFLKILELGSLHT
jgi:hypothetical protein